MKNTPLIILVNKKVYINARTLYMITTASVNGDLLRKWVKNITDYETIPERRSELQFDINAKYVPLSTVTKHTYNIAHTKTAKALLKLLEEFGNDPDTDLPSSLLENISDFDEDSHGENNSILDRVTLTNSVIYDTAVIMEEAKRSKRTTIYG